MTVEQLFEYIDFSKKCSQEMLKAALQFAKDYPYAEVEYYKKVLTALSKGFTYEQIKKHYEKEQFEKGQKIAKEEFKTIYKMEDCFDEMTYDLLHGKEKGSPTHVGDLDNAWTWRRGEFNIWTGYTNEGKSQFIRFISLVKAIKDKWKIAFCAPEDFPAKEFFDDFIHTASGRSTDKDNNNCIRLSTYKEVYNKIKDYFYFVYIRPPENTLINVLKEFDRLIDEDGVKAAIIDPIIKLTRPKEFMLADDKYAGYVTTLLTDFARQKNISLHMVMHQTTPTAQENGLFPKPSYYRIKGGGTWADGTDNVLTIQRPLYNRDKLDDEVLFMSDKIKKQKLVGVPQEIKFRFNRKTNRYVDYNTKKDLFDFREALYGEQLTLLNYE